MASSGIKGAAKRTYNAVMARIFSTHGNQPAVMAHSTRIPFRPRSARPAATSQISASPTQDPSSISGLKFCLHLVVFAAPGVVLAKKMCDGERLEEIVQRTQDAVSALINNPA